MFVYTISDIIGLVALGVVLLTLIVLVLVLIVQVLGEGLLGRATRRDTEPVDPKLIVMDPEDVPDIIDRKQEE